MLISTMALYTSGCASKVPMHASIHQSGDVAQERLTTARAEITIEVKELHGLDKQIHSLARTKEGAVMNSSINSGKRYYALIKIPSAELDDTLN